MGWAFGTILLLRHLSAATASFSPSWMRFRALDFGGADQARPNLVVPVIAWRDIPTFPSAAVGTDPAAALFTLQHGTFRHHAVLHVAPQRHQQLARQRYNRDALRPRAL